MGIEYKFRGGDIVLVKDNVIYPSSFHNLNLYYQLRLEELVEEMKVQEERVNRIVVPAAFVLIFGALAYESALFLYKILGS